MRTLFPSCLHIRDPAPLCAMLLPAQSSFILVIAASNEINPFNTTIQPEPAPQA